MSAQPDPTDRHPSIQKLRSHFAYEHLPPKLQRVSRHFAITADLMLQWLPDSPELTVCLRKLLDARDCALRAALDLPDEE
jgi:hypothetical protein